MLHLLVLGISPKFQEFTGTNQKCYDKGGHVVYCKQSSYSG